jgi:hypothetical protein
MGSTKELQLQVTDEVLEGIVEVDAVDVSVSLGLSLDLDPAELEQHQSLVSAWLGQGLSMRADGAACPVETGTPTLGGSPEGSTVSIPIIYRCPASAATVTLRDSTVYTDDPEHRTFVVVQRPGGESETAVLRAGAQELRISRHPETSRTVAAFVEEGAVHLVTGYDHLLFLLSLLLVAGLTVQRQGMRQALADVTWVVTAFTVGHSLSLAAAALGYVHLPAKWVEVAIAGSIVLVAGINVLRPKTPTAATRRTRATIAGAFGLVHGFGFSSVLAEVGLPTADRVVALLSFNVGIELAQLGLVAALLLPLGYASRRRMYRRVVVQGGSLAIAAMGCFWLVERTLGG